MSARLEQQRGVNPAQIHVTVQRQVAGDGGAYGTRAVKRVERRRPRSQAQRADARTAAAGRAQAQGARCVYRQCRGGAGGRDGARADAERLAATQGQRLARGQVDRPETQCVWRARRLDRCIVTHRQGATGAGRAVDHKCPRA